MRNIAMRKRFEWWRISEDGLLKRPPLSGPYYQQYGFDDFYDTEEDAIKAYQDMLKRDEYYTHRLVLLTVWYAEEEMPRDKKEKQNERILDT